MPERVMEVRDLRSGILLGWVVIDSTVQGRSHGGLRISAHLSREELVVLARRMTLKFGFLGLANGGAKAGIIGDAEGASEQRLALLRSFAEAIQPLVKSRAYMPHPDMGTTDREIGLAFSEAGYQPTREDSGNYTAIGLCIAAHAAFEIQGKRMAGATVSIEGFGKVGRSLARLLHENGAKVIAVSTSCGAIYRKEGLDVGALLQQCEVKGSPFVLDFPEAEQISREELLEVPADLLCPCAISATIHFSNAGGITAKMICPGANAPVTPEAEEMLSAAGVRVLPDFLTNAGGVLGGTLAFAGISPARIPMLMSEYLAPRYEMLFRKSLPEVEQHCLERHAAVKAAAERGGLGQKFLTAGLALYRKGWIPKSLMGHLAENYILSR